MCAAMPGVVRRCLVRLACDMSTINFLNASQRIPPPISVAVGVAVQPQAVRVLAVVTVSAHAGPVVEHSIPGWIVEPTGLVEGTPLGVADSDSLDFLEFKVMS